MSRHGCSNSRKIDEAFQVYLHLCEELKVWDITHDYSPDADLIYIRAKLQENADFDVFIPLDMNSDVTPQSLCALQNELGVKSEGKSVKSIKLAFVGSDSSILIHEMIHDIAPFSARKRKKVDAECALAHTVRQFVRENNVDSMGQD